MSYNRDLAQYPWIKAADGTGEKRFGFYCERCNAELPMGLPCAIGGYVDAAKKFIVQHSACRLPGKPPQFDDGQTQL